VAVRLLIVLPGALGDVVRALPLLGRIRRAHPGAQLGWAVEPLSAPLLAGHPWLDTVHVFERRRGVRGLVALLRQVRAAGYEVALDLGRSAKSGLIALGSGARARFGFAPEDAREGSWLVANRRLPPQGVERPKLAQFLAFGDALAVPPAPIEFGLTPTDAEAHQARQLTSGLEGPLVAACVGSSCPSRRWLPERTAATLRTLRTRFGTSSVLLGAGGDAPYAASVLDAADAGVRDLVGRTTLRQLLAVLARSRLVFGPDSGALHLAAALGRPVVSLWGATSPLRSTPFGGEALTVTGNAPCAPCFLRDCPIGRVCMRDIPSEAVVARAATVLER
jgi:lipopolysaccharide heptosyltransferase II